MGAPTKQVLFFQHLKAQLPLHKSMVEEVAEVLGISTDSAYRRIRGEKAIDLEEICKLCSQFHISIDQLLHLPGEAMIFTGKLYSYAPDNFGKWLQDLQQQLELINSFGKKHIYVLIKDIPPFYHFQVPELAAFKFFFWMKSILHEEKLKGEKFKVHDERYQGLFDRCKKVVALYNQIPTTEIWNIESLNTSLRQIRFYQEANMFTSTQDIILLYQKIEEMVNHIESQAELGLKFTLGQQPNENAPSYRLFVNELILGDNTFLAQLDNERITFLNHGVLYFISTRDEGFNNAMFDSLDNLMKKSTLISSVGEKERNKFFSNLRQNIHRSLEAL